MVREIRAQDRDLSASARLGNNVAATLISYDTVENDFRHFDALPLEIRRVIADAAVKLACGALADHAAWSVKNGGIGRTIDRIHEFERNEILAFAGQWRDAAGRGYPHVAADATIQQYGLRGPRGPSLPGIVRRWR